MAVSLRVCKRVADGEMARPMRRVCYAKLVASAKYCTPFKWSGKYFIEFETQVLNNYLELNFMHKNGTALNYATLFHVL